MVIQEHFPQSVDNSYRMIDVSEKVATQRRAIAEGRIYINPLVIERIIRRQMPKGDVLALAEVAGIIAAKNTAQILPLCHPLQLDSVKVSCKPFFDHIIISAEVRANGKTGVEMESLCAVNAALLCIYDLTKIVEPEMTISDVHLLRKEGGKSGVWEPSNIREPISPQKKPTLSHCGVRPNLQSIKSAVVTVSDRCSQGVANDKSGPQITEWLRGRGADVFCQELVSDDRTKIQDMIRLLVNDGCQLIVTTGGTGLSPRDVTPESILEIADREIVGFGELLRAKGAESTPMSYLSRSVGVLIGSSVIIALPGNPKAVIEGLVTLEGILPHALHISKGGQHGGEHVSKPVS